MPELPEVETVRHDLDRLLSGHRIERIAVTGSRTVRRHDVAHLRGEVEGRTVQAVRRHGKYLLLDLDSSFTLIVHLRMSGMLLWVPEGSAEASLDLPRHTHVRLHLETGDELRFVDPRTFGEFWVTDDLSSTFAHVGPDAWLGVKTPAELRERLRRRTSALKIALVNQHVVAGIGNIYADEICWEGRIRPNRPATSLSRNAVERVHAAMKVVLARAIAARGSSLSDEQYVDVFGATGSAQLMHEVYARQGEACRRCGGVIERIPIGARSAFFCRKCQR